ncbi:MAG: hypothetical protein LAO51_00495 [Acidobacteriia bacterium]|nr:hypothetical protein [Terriglobia bacterium]
MSLRRTIGIALLAAAAIAMAGLVYADDKPKLVIGGTTYTKWLWGNQRYGGSMYNFTTVPGEGFGDNGQGSEVELLLDAKLSKAVEVKARLHSRFNQNEWTNFGGFGGRNPGSGAGSLGPCVSGDCGEWDPRSNQYVKLRGVAVVLTPGYKWIDSATIGANDFGQFDPFVIGRIRYIDRDNASGLLFQGSAAHRKFTWDFTRISLPRLWAGPNYGTGTYTAADAAYGLQFKVAASSVFDIGGIAEYVRDQELNSLDLNLDNGVSIKTRFRNSVGGIKFGVHPSSNYDILGAYYYSSHDSNPTFGAPSSFNIGGGFSPVIAGKHDDSSFKVDFTASDPFGVGLSFALQAFDIGAQYTSMMASRREADVLLTEGHDSTWAYPGPNNAKYGVFGSRSVNDPNSDGFNRSVIGYAGWDGNAMQVPTINVDNEFTDFDEPMAETCIGWKGVTLVPTWTKGALEIRGEVTHIGYNTNWQAWGDPSHDIENSPYPAMELDTGVGHNFRSAFAPFSDKKTDIALVGFKYVIEAGKGIDLFGKVKYIKETDNRMNNAKYLPYAAGDCPATPTLDVDGGCLGVQNYYFDAGDDGPRFSSAALYGNPPVITGAGGVVGYQWKPFDSLSDDDRDEKYWLYQIGAGYQLTNDLYGSLTYEYYDVDLKDGNTAFQAYRVHEMASGKHTKNRISAKFRYILAGAEFGLEYQYAFGTFEPDFGGGFVPQVADADIAAAHNVPVGSLGFSGHFGGWNSLEKREFRQSHIKAFMKVQF